MRYIKGHIRQCIEVFEESYGSFLFTYGVICIANMVYLNYLQNVNYASFSISAADFLLLSELPFFRSIFVAPFFLFFIISVNSYDLRINRVVRMKGMKRLWKMQIYKNTLLTFILSVFMAVFLVCLGYSNADEWINFDNRFSLFAFMNDGYTVKGATFITALFMFVISLFLYMESTVVCFLLLWWGTNKKIVAFLVTYIALLMEAYVIKIPVLFDRAGIGYERWHDKNFGFFSTAFIILILFAISINTAGRRELLDDKK